MLMAPLLIFVLLLIMATFRLSLGKKQLVKQVCCTKDVEIMVSLKYLSSFWRTLEVLLINCEINVTLTWSANCVLPHTGNQETTIPITDTNLYVPIVALSKQNNTKLLQQLKSGFKSKKSQNQSKVKMQAPNSYLDYLIDPSFHGVKRLFLL